MQATHKICSFLFDAQIFRYENFSNMKLFTFDVIQFGIPRNVSTFQHLQLHPVE